MSRISVSRPMMAVLAVLLLAASVSGRHASLAEEIETEYPSGPHPLEDSDEARALYSPEFRRLVREALDRAQSFGPSGGVVLAELDSSTGGQIDAEALQQGTSCVCAVSSDSVRTNVLAQCTLFDGAWVDPNPNYVCNCRGITSPCSTSSVFKSVTLPPNMATCDGELKMDPVASPACLHPTSGNGTCGGAAGIATTLQNTGKALAFDKDGETVVQVSCSTNTIRKPCTSTLPCSNVDCKVSDPVVSPCSVSCGGGIRTLTRTIITPAVGGGLPCPPLEEKQSCNTQPCDVDCVVGEWAALSDCSAQCGGGTQNFTRPILVNPVGKGAPCPPLAQTMICNTKPCDQDCVLSAWQNGTCSVSCGGGTRTDVRTVSVLPAGSGAACGNLSRTLVCNTEPCPIDCVVGDWTPGPCSVSCGGGTRTMTRRVITAPAGAGQACPELSMVESCNQQICAQDCVVSNWTIGTCSVSCGGGTRTNTRTVLTLPAGNGAPCPPLSATEACNTGDCPVDCVVGDWQPGVCSVPCGAGTMISTRQVIVQPKGAGQPCPALTRVDPCNGGSCDRNCTVGEWTVGACSASCGGGTRVKTRPVLVEPLGNGAPCPPTSVAEACNTQPCDQDCVVSDWVVGTCSAPCGGGVRTDRRTVLIPNTGNGAVCPELVRNSPCNNQACAQDCVVSNWTLTGCTAVCGGGIATATRSVVQLPVFPGQACPPLIDVKPCNTNPCVEDCVGTYSPFGPCSVSCGGGIMVATRVILQPERNGGAPCNLTDKIIVPCNQAPCSTSCKVGAWSDYTQCSASCGGGVQFRTRNVTIAPVNNGDICPPLIEQRECNTQTCPAQDCVPGPWGPLSTCSKSCGGGVARRTRAIEQPAKNGGSDCILTQDQVCNTWPCPIDCKVSNWGSWGNCSKTCGGGVQMRRREILVPNTDGGAPCPSTLTDVRECNVYPCPSYQDCQLSDWTEWSNCSASCGTGVQIRSRSVLVAASAFGDQCGPTVEERECRAAKPCNCTMGSWSEWTTCSRTCGGGVRTRTRQIVAMLHPDAVCDITMQTENCNTDACPRDCVVSDWSAWSPCDRPCGGGQSLRHRSVLVPPANGGAPCPPLDDVQNCNVDVCAQDCKVSDWGDWGICSKPCGGGVMNRTRALVRPSANTGAACPPLIEINECNTSPCPACTYSDWTTFGECSASCGGGSQSRTRQLIQDSVPGAPPCTEPLVDSRPCNVQNCPIDCVVGAWPDSWTPCSKSCGGGLQARTRTILVKPQYGGKACPETNQTVPCNEQPCPQDCKLSEWGAWGPCQALCGNGIQVRNRTVEIAAENGGKPCGVLSQTQPCTGQPCKVDCKLTDWSDWSQCSASCGTGYADRTRSILANAQYGGAECGALRESMPCNSQPCPQDCVVGAWTAWSNCSSACSGGTRQRTRPIITQAANGGKACPALTQVQECNDLDCPVDCQLNAWTPYSDCSAPCGGGVQKRTRTIRVAPANGGAPCQPLSQVQECNSQPCNANCTFGAWSAWSDCSASCNGGTKTRTRLQTAGEPGTCGPLTQTISCADHPCPQDCTVGAWSAFSTCSASCGGGVMTRKRAVLTPESNGGKACPPIREDRPCNTLPCPVDCQVTQWSDWSKCSAWCGTGLKRRTRQILTADSFGGRPCPNLIEDSECIVQACDPACTYSDWTAWTNCTGSCGGGVMARSRQLVSGPAPSSASNITNTGATNAIAANAANAMMTALRFAGPLPSTNVRRKDAMRFLSVILEQGQVPTAPLVSVSSSSESNAICGELRQEKACNSLPCPVDCQVSAVDPANPLNSACSESCGAGVRAVLRTVTQVPSGGGRNCPALELEAPCNNGACPPSGSISIPDIPMTGEVLDCKVSGWSEWSDCQGATPVNGVTAPVSTLRAAAARTKAAKASPPLASIKTMTISRKQDSEAAAESAAEDSDEGSDDDDSEESSDDDEEEDTLFVELASEAELVQIGKLTPVPLVTASTGSSSESSFSQCNSCSQKVLTCQQTCQQKAAAKAKFVPLSEVHPDAVVASKSKANSCRFKSCRNYAKEETSSKDAAEVQALASEAGVKDPAFNDYAKQIAELFPSDDATVADLDSALASGDHRFNSDQASVLLTMSPKEKAKLVAWAQAHRHTKAHKLPVRRMKSEVSENVVDESKVPHPVRKPRFASVDDYADIYDDAFIEIEDCLPTCSEIHQSCNSAFCGLQHGPDAEFAAHKVESLPNGKLYRAINVKTLAAFDTEHNIPTDGSKPTDGCVLATGGTQFRYRTVLIPATNGGLGCPPIREVRSCDVYNTSNPVCVYKMPSSSNAIPSARFAMKSVEAPLPLHISNPSYSPQFYSAPVHEANFGVVPHKDEDDESESDSADLEGEDETESESAETIAAARANRIETMKRRSLVSKLRKGPAAPAKDDPILQDIDALAAQELSALENASAEEDQIAQKHLAELAQSFGKSVMNALDTKEMAEALEGKANSAKPKVPKAQPAAPKAVESKPKLTTRMAAVQTAAPAPTPAVPVAQPQAPTKKYIIPKPLFSPEYKDKVEAPPAVKIDPKKIVGESYVTTRASDAGGVLYMHSLSAASAAAAPAVLTPIAPAAGKVSATTGTNKDNSVTPTIVGSLTAPTPSVSFVPPGKSAAAVPPAPFAQPSSSFDPLVPRKADSSDSYTSHFSLNEASSKETFGAQVPGGKDYYGSPKPRPRFSQAQEQEGGGIPVDAKSAPVEAELADTFPSFLATATRAIRGARNALQPEF